MSQVGYTIIFGGTDFVPDDFMKESMLVPDNIVRRSAEYSALEFSDLHEGKCPFDIASEAFDFLDGYRKEFMRLSRFKGIEIRRLNILTSNGKLMTELAAEHVALLHELSMAVAFWASVSEELE